VRGQRERETRARGRRVSGGTERVERRSRKGERNRRESVPVRKRREKRRLRCEPEDRESKEEERKRRHLAGTIQATNAPFLHGRICWTRTRDDLEAVVELLCAKFGSSSGHPWKRLLQRRGGRRKRGNEKEKVSLGNPFRRPPETSLDLDREVREKKRDSLVQTLLQKAESESQSERPFERGDETSLIPL
jgi:hypothetical protein